MYGFNRRLRRSLRHNESGFALASVMFLGAVLVLLTAIIVVRATSQSEIEVNDAQWEQSLHVAEGTMDDFLAQLAQVSDPDSIDTGHTSSQFTDKDTIIGLADSYAEANPSEVYSTPEGEAVILKPSDEQIMYAVGFTPSRDFFGRQARVIEVEYEYGTAAGSWSPILALLTGDTIKISGTTKLEGSAGGMHGNEDLDLDGEIHLDACLTLSEDLFGSTSRIKKLGPGCPTNKSGIEWNPIVPLPAMNARDLWPDAEYQMCPNGRVRAGPNHPTLGNGGAVGANPWDQPCRSGATQIFNADGSEWRGWKMVGDDSKLGAKWDYTTNTAYDGAYYFYRGSVKIGPNPTGWDIQVVTEAQGGIGNKKGGDIEISGNPEYYPYYSDNDVVFFSDRDFIISGNPISEGIHVSKEQLKISGNPEILGAFINHGEQDSGSKSDIHDSEISGNPIITYEGSGTTEWVGSGSGAAEFTILRRTER